MKCAGPYWRGVQEWPCGKCVPCRVNRSRTWSFRLVLESLLHPYAYFVTLTYAPAFLPVTGSVEPRALQLFLKRLRKEVGTLRYYAVGEYGDKSMRPHYHLAVFTSCPPDVFLRGVESAWQEDGQPIGLVHVGEITSASAAYIVGYVVKHCTRRDDPRLGGRHPEFARMSLKPGLGRDMMKRLGGQIDKVDRAFDVVGDVPSQLRFDGKMWPLGRYLKDKLREDLGVFKRTFTRVDMPLDPRLLEKREMLSSKVERENYEARRIYGARLVEGRVNRKRQRSVL